MCQSCRRLAARHAAAVERLQQRFSIERRQTSLMVKQRCAEIMAVGW
jgi:hypothetical protein